MSRHDYVMLQERAYGASTRPGWLMRTLYISFASVATVLFAAPLYAGDASEKKTPAPIEQTLGSIGTGGGQCSGVQPLWQLARQKTRDPQPTREKCCNKEYEDNKAACLEKFPGRNNRELDRQLGCLESASAVRSLCRSGFGSCQ